MEPELEVELELELELEVELWWVWLWVWWWGGLFLGCLGSSVLPEDLHVQYNNTM